MSLKKIMRKVTKAKAERGTNVLGENRPIGSLQRSINSTREFREHQASLNEDGSEDLGEKRGDPLTKAQSTKRGRSRTKRKGKTPNRIKSMAAKKSHRKRTASSYVIASKKGQKTGRRLGTKPAAKKESVEEGTHEVLVYHEMLADMDEETRNEYFEAINEVGLESYHEYLECLTEEPTEPVEEPTEPTEPVEEPTEPVEEPTEPVEEGCKPDHKDDDEDDEDEKKDEASPIFTAIKKGRDKKKGKKESSEIVDPIGEMLTGGEESSLVDQGDLDPVGKDKKTKDPKPGGQVVGKDPDTKSKVKNTKGDTPEYKDANHSPGHGQDRGQISGYGY